MNFENPFLLVLLGVGVAGVFYWWATHYFSAEAKQERRRRRNNARVTSTARRPSVKFSVRTPKRKK